MTSRLGKILLRAALPLVLVGYLATGVYSVAPDEGAVAFVAGRAVARDVGPGIHWNLPWPLGRVRVAKTTTNFFMPIGYRFQEGLGPPISNLWLTGDTNIVSVELDIQYQVRSLGDFLLVHEQPRELVRRCGERALTRFLVAEGVDAVLTTSRHELRLDVQSVVQAELDRERTGIEIQSVSVRELSPPMQGLVRSAFQEVQNARADSDRLVHEARAYRAQVLAEADGEAKRIGSEAQARKVARMELASGDADRFRSLAAEHARAPVLTEKRLHREALERLLPRVEKYVVSPGPDGEVNLRIVQ